MALIGIEVPKEISDILSRINVPGKKETQHHITMFYFEEDELFVDQVSEMHLIISEVLENILPFDVTIKEVSSFPSGKYGTPIKCDIISDKLIQIRKDLAKKFDQNKIVFSKKFKEYLPHLTLAYNDKDWDKKVKLSVPITWTVGGIALWSAGIGINGTNINFSFGKKLSSIDKSLRLSYILKRATSLIV